MKQAASSKLAEKRNLNKSLKKEFFKINLLAPTLVLVEILILIFGIVSFYHQRDYWFGFPIVFILIFAFSAPFISYQFLDFFNSICSFMSLKKVETINDFLVWSEARQPYSQKMVAHKYALQKFLENPASCGLSKEKYSLLKEVVDYLKRIRIEDFFFGELVNSSIVVRESPLIITVPLSTRARTAITSLSREGNWIEEEIRKYHGAEVMGFSRDNFSLNHSREKTEIESRAGDSVPIHEKHWGNIVGVSFPFKRNGRTLKLEFIDIPYLNSCL